MSIAYVMGLQAGMQKSAAGVGALPVPGSDDMSRLTRKPNALIKLLGSLGEGAAGAADFVGGDDWGQKNLINTPDHARQLRRMEGAAIPKKIQSIADPLKQQGALSRYKKILAGRARTRSAAGVGATVAAVPAAYLLGKSLFGQPQQQQQPSPYPQGMM